MENPYSEEHKAAGTALVENPHANVITDRHSNAPGDWVVTIDGEIPGSLLIPASIFQIIRDYDAEIDYFDRTEHGPMVGCRHPLGGFDGAGIEVLRDSIRFHVHDTVSDRQPDYEAVANENPSADAFRTIQKKTRLEIYNIHEHSERGGLSIYLLDPDK